MERHFKIFLMAFIGLVFPCLSFAYPDSYIFNNFLQGASPFIGVKNDYTLSSNGLWEKYIPSLGQSDNILDGIVVSYSDDFMQGSNPASAVPLVNLSKYGPNAKFVLPAGGCCVVTSDGDLDGFQFSSSVKGVLLGTTSPTDFSSENWTSAPRYSYNTFFVKDTSLTSPSEDKISVTNSLKYSSSINDSVVQFYSANFYNLNDITGLLNTNNSTFLPYDDTSLIWFIYNDNNSAVNFFTSSSSGSEIVLDFIPFSAVTWSLYASSNTSSTSSSAVVTGRNVYYFPDIAGDIDIYSFMWNNTTSGQYYCFSLLYNVKLNISPFVQYGTVNYFYAPVNYSYNARCFSYFHALNSELEGVDGSYIPIFLRSAVRYIGSTAIMVNGGYININNYEELVALLKESGVGSSDLSRIERLLEEINSGGATGAEVKELIDILENYHQQLVNNADFGSVTNVFETYKNLLDFSDDMHWLITANNALFAYFAGFIMLCAMFLILNRIMR